VSLSRILHDHRQFRKLFRKAHQFTDSPAKTTQQLSPDYGTCIEIPNSGTAEALA